ncbi:Propanediol utilization protein PduV [Caloramator mitchellensis]|uniref:Propanediol utilization protein PduV n=1 Tax=Caloramator mitchellensis TaxID=908809 RepID=A0A0R3K0U0_CALMK|nr:EutP/PduV family microcompartment system protein [Caloramator mitchellensis]KRQ86482.1 Propanediol utilization protein PduV [Caloramator mitchellensis]
MKKIMLIGKSGCGKTTLVQAILNKELISKKTQSFEYHQCILDTPGEYIEYRNYIRAIISEAVNYDIIAFLQDATQENCIFPPNFAYIFSKKVVGIVTKIDVDHCNLKLAEECLRRAGVKEIYYVSSYNKIGIDELRKLLL